MAGRPKVNIDWERVEQMLKADCTAESIAASMGFDRDTLYNRCKQDNKLDFSAYSQQKRALGADLLRMKQFDLAMAGDKTMLIWLGKQRLGQSEKQEQVGSVRLDIKKAGDLTDDELASIAAK